MNKSILEDALKVRIDSLFSVSSGSKALEEFLKNNFGFRCDLEVGVKDGTFDFNKAKKDYKDCVEKLKNDVEKNSKPFLDGLEGVEEIFKELKKLEKKDKKNE